MRLLVSVSLTALFALGGCLSASGENMTLVAPPSWEKTNSIVKPVRPVEDLDGAQRAPAAKQARPKRQKAPEPKTEEVEPAAFIAPASPMPKPPAPKARKQAPDDQMETVRPMSPETMKIYRKRFRDAKPINFGSSKPKNYAVHGVDVSRWQGNINWPKLRTQGANFAFIKATDGGDHLDPSFRRNWKGAHEAGLKRGAYHFFYWCRSAESQAKWFIRNVPKSPGALPPVIDVEWNHLSNCKKRPSPAVVREKMQVFMDKLEAHYGQRPIIYTAPDFYDDNLKGAFPNHPFWLRAVARHPSKVYPNRKWVFWQYSGSGLSQGVNGKIDLNAFRGSEDDWHQWVANNQR